MKKKLIVKIGTSTLTLGTNRISQGKIEDIARQIVVLKKNYDIILISSGAIATAKQFVEINGFHKQVDSKQAMAAIGQPKLMRIYDEIFSSFGLKVSQCLMTYRDFENVAAKVNTQKTIIKLLEHDYIPIINENDTVAIEEIVFGDNDKLSALVMSKLDADLLVILSDIDGLYNDDPRVNKSAKVIPFVEEITKEIESLGFEASKNGRGGMKTKLESY